MHSTRCGPRTSSTARPRIEGQLPGTGYRVPGNHLYIKTPVVGTRDMLSRCNSTPAAALRSRRLAASKSDLLRKFRTLGRVVRRDHGIVGGKSPFRAIGVGRKIEARTNVTLEHLQFLAVFQ